MRGRGAAHLEALSEALAFALTASCKGAVSHVDVVTAETQQPLRTKVHRRVWRGDYLESSPGVHPSCPLFGRGGRRISVGDQVLFRSMLDFYQFRNGVGRIVRWDGHGTVTLAAGSGRVYVVRAGCCARHDAWVALGGSFPHDEWLEQFEEGEPGGSGNFHCGRVWVPIDGVVSMLLHGSMPEGSVAVSLKRA